MVTARAVAAPLERDAADKQQLLTALNMVK